MKEGFSDSETQAGRLQRCAHKRDACAMKDSFELLEEKHIFPSEGFDGFYMALLKKVG